MDRTKISEISNACADVQYAAKVLLEKDGERPLVIKVFKRNCDSLKELLELLIA